MKAIAGGELCVFKVKIYFMKEKIKKLKISIKIPILIGVIVGALILSGIGYAGLKIYKYTLNDKLEREKTTQGIEKMRQENKKKQQELEKISQKSREEQQKLILSQQKVIEESRQVLKETKKEKQELDIKTSQLQQELNIEKNKPKDLIIQASEIKPYLNGIVKVSCKNSYGSGSLWNLYGQYLVLTNYHVVETPYSNNNCFVDFRDIDSEWGVPGHGGGMYQIYPPTAKSWNIFTDVALVSLNKMETCDDNGLNCFKNKPIENLNYGLSFLNKCSSKVSINAPVVILGYPAFGKTKFSFELEGESLEGNQSNLIVSNGTVSGYDDSSKQPLGNLPYFNYFVSAKIDSGNSGGIALSKDKSGLCVLGIPTWLSVGVYETQGLIQNIHNVMFIE